MKRLHLGKINIFFPRRRDGVFASGKIVARLAAHYFSFTCDTIARVPELAGNLR